MEKVAVSYSVTLVMIAGLVSEYENDIVIYPLIKDAMSTLIEYLEFMEEGLYKDLDSDVAKFILKLGLRVSRATTLQLKAKVAVDILITELTKRGLAVEGSVILKS